VVVLEVKSDSMPVAGTKLSQLMEEAYDQRIDKIGRSSAVCSFWIA